MEGVGDEGPESGGGRSRPVCRWWWNVRAGEQGGDEPSAYLGGLFVSIGGVYVYELGYAAVTNGICELTFGGRSTRATSISRSLSG